MFMHAWIGLYLFNQSGEKIWEKFRVSKSVFIRPGGAGRLFSCLLVYVTFLIVFCIIKMFGILFYFSCIATWENLYYNFCRAFHCASFRKVQDFIICLYRDIRKTNYVANILGYPVYTHILSRSVVKFYVSFLFVSLLYRYMSGLCSFTINYNHQC
jgi:hypothetical protein